MANYRRLSLHTSTKSLWSPLFPAEISLEKYLQKPQELQVTTGSFLHPQLLK